MEPHFNVDVEELIRRDIESRVNALAILKSRMDEALRANRPDIASRIEDAYTAFRKDTLKVFEYVGKSEEELDKLLSQALKNPLP